MANYDVTTPCTGACKLNSKGYCVGCLRHGDEIAIWTRLSENQRKIIMNELGKRSAD